jgi:hypothetical protein
MEAQVTGRMSLKGKAALVGETLPKRKPGDALEKRVRELIQDAFNASAPTGSATSIEVVLAGEKLKLDLGPGAIKSPAFEVSGRFSAAKKTITLPACEVTGAALTLDATFWLTPKPVPTPASPPGPSATPPAGAAPGGAAPVPAPAGAAAPPAASESNVVRYSFGGSAAAFGTGTRSATVVAKTAMDAFEARIPAVMKGHAFFQTPEQRAAFFQEERAWFGTDEKTLDHFEKLRVVNVKGARTILHEEAAKRLEAVQAEIGQANMPSSGGVGWPRAEATMAGEQTIGNLHNLGFAIDYNATQAPHMKDQRLLDLAQLMGGRGAAMKSNAPPKGYDHKKVGETFTSGTDAEKKKLEDDPKIQTWLDEVAAEAQSLGDASEKFRSSLQVTEKGVLTDYGPKLIELREKWRAAATETERQAVMTQLPAVIKPWTDAVAGQETSMRKKIKDAGFDIDKLPTGKALNTASSAASKLDSRVEGLIKGLASPLKKGQRASIDKLLAEARKMLVESAKPLADDKAAVEELKRLAAMVKARSAALGQKMWLARMTALSGALQSGTFVFGDPKADKYAVVDPSAAQMADVGFFNLRGSAKAGEAGFGPDFVRSMAKHGFHHLGNWATPDLMHWELRWGKPS